MTMDVSYIASGFHEDCVTLLENFKQQESLRFETFCNIWRELKFSHIFLGRKTYAELLEFCEECLNIAKEFSTVSTDLVDQIGGLFLLYGLYYKIPIENVKIRVTLKEWQTLLVLHRTIKDEKLYDASYIFVKLVTDCAFHHCLFTKEYGLEKSYKSHQENLFENKYSILTNIIDEIEGGELSKIQDLSKIYDEQKTLLLNNPSSTSKLQLFDKNFMNDIIDEIETLQQNRKTLIGLRRKSKDFTFNNNSNSKTGKKFTYDDKIRSKLGHGFDTDSSDDDENIDIQFDYMTSNNHESLERDFNETEIEISEQKEEKSGVKKGAIKRKAKITECEFVKVDSLDNDTEVEYCLENDSVDGNDISVVEIDVT